MACDAYDRRCRATNRGDHVDSTAKASATQEELERRMDETRQPGVDAMLTAYREIEAAYFGAATANDEPPVITTNTAWA